jgi:hypothetical protein
MIIKLNILCIVLLGLIVFTKAIKSEIANSKPSLLDSATLSIEEHNNKLNINKYEIIENSVKDASTKENNEAKIIIIEKQIPLSHDYYYSKDINNFDEIFLLTSKEEQDYYYDKDAKPDIIKEDKTVIQVKEEEIIEKSLPLSSIAEEEHYYSTDNINNDKIKTIPSGLTSNYICL